MRSRIEARPELLTPTPQTDNPTIGGFNNTAGKER